MQSAALLANLFGSAWHVNATAIIAALGHLTGAGNPNGVQTPSYIGQEYYDTTGKQFYRATDTTATSWVEITTAGGGGSGAIVNTAITTVGAGTLTAAAIAGGVITRSGSTAAYTDTTDTAAAIIAAMADQVTGSSFLLHIRNTVNFAETIAGGTGVTLSGNTVVAPNSLGLFLVTVTGAAAVSILGIADMPLASIPDAQYSTAALQSTVALAANIAGAKVVAFENTGTTPANLQFDTAANIVAAIPNAKIGMSYTLKIRNSSGSANTATMTTNTGLTLHGTMTIAQNVTRDFVVVLTSLSAVDIYSMGISAAGA